MKALTVEEIEKLLTMKKCAGEFTTDEYIYSVQSIGENKPKRVTGKNLKVIEEAYLALKQTFNLIE